MMGLKRILVWLWRIRRCRGFGVQSPWAYGMVRYVINEHWPYYAYEPLRRTFPGVDAVTRRLCELCLRLANRVRPSAALLHGVDGRMFGSYVMAGCRCTACCSDVGECVRKCDGGAVMAVIAPGQGFADAYGSVAKMAADGSAVILVGIHGDKAMRRLWREVVARQEGVVTFDLYYCGLVCFDAKRYKQNYIINF